MGHIIRNQESSEIINYQEPTLKIGNHVWLDNDVQVLKNANIPANCIVGVGSIVDSFFTEQNTAIAGNPAKVISQSVIWERDV